MATLTGRTAIVTGASSGIGLAIARKLAREGAIVAITGKREQRAEEAARQLRDDGYDAFALRCDVASEEDVAQTVRSVFERHGRVDILVNNAGLQHVEPLEHFPTEMFDLMLRVMVTGAFLGIKHVFPIMKAQRSGRIINIASVTGAIGFAGKAAYVSAKHGVIGLTKVAALEGAQHGITVNALCPGYVDTPLVRGQLEQLAAMRGVTVDRVLEEVIYPLVPQKRLLDPEEIADFAAMIAGDGMRGVTGASLMIDGGYTAQ